MSEVTQTPVLDLLASMTADSIEASSLDAETLMLVRIAALAAVDAPPISYALNLEAASDLDIDPDQVRGVLAAIAPIVGTARIASATGNIVQALAVAIEVAEVEEGRENCNSRAWPVLLRDGLRTQALAARRTHEERKAVMRRRRSPIATAAVVGGVAHHAAKSGAEAAAAEGQQQEQAPPAPVPASAEGGMSSDQMEQLKQLAQLHEQGILTDEEFAAQKAKVLGG